MTMAPKTTALDLSLTSTGWADPQGYGMWKPPAGADRGVERLVWIRDQVVRLAASASLVVLEGYSYASRGRASISLGELGGVVRLALFEAGVPVVVIPPSSRAKYATGRGNAGKDAVLAEAIRRLGYAGHSCDEADALWLLAMAADRYDLPGKVMVPKTHRAALSGVTWPDLRMQPEERE